MIHQYKNNGYNIVLDVNSGAIHVVDEVSYALIEKMDEVITAANDDIVAAAVKAADETNMVESGEAAQKAAAQRTLQVLGESEAVVLEAGVSAANMTATASGTTTANAAATGAPTEADVKEAFEELKELITDQTLFTVDIYENRIIDYKNRNTVVKALCLHIAHDCNLACKYCFAEEGEYHGRRALMDYETGKQALDFLIANSGSRRNLEVDFFGGEPLMNFEVVKKLVAYGREQEKLHDKHFRFTLTTNGVLLNDEVKEFANKECDNVVLSIDGRKEVHDNMRPFRKGAGSYDLIVPKFQDLAESRNQEKYYVRGTFTHFNTDFSKDVLHLADLGFKQISVEPVVAQETDEYALREEDLPTLFAEYDKLAAEMVERKKNGNDFNFFHFMIDLEGGPCVYKRLSGCGSGTEYLAVTPWGDLYPCHQFVGNEKFLMGTVWDGVQNTELRDEFKCCNVYAKEKCRNCFARFYCSGGCAANSYNFHGKITDAYDLGCELQKKRIECAIMIKAAEAEM